MGGPNWTIYPGQKSQPYHNQPSGASLCSAIGRGTERRPCLWQWKLRGIFDTWVGRWKAWPIGDWAFHFNGSARSHSIKTAQSTLFGLVGAESPRQRRSGCILWRAFFWNYGRRGSFKASLNCHRVDEFDCSAQSLASKT